MSKTDQLKRVRECYSHLSERHLMVKRGELHLQRLQCVEESPVCRDEAGVICVSHPWMLFSGRAAGIAINRPGCHTSTLMYSEAGQWRRFCRQMMVQPFFRPAKHYYT